MNEVEIQRVKMEMDSECWNARSSFEKMRLVLDGLGALDPELAQRIQSAKETALYALDVLREALDARMDALKAKGGKQTD